tara:strand:+ start:417 stop:638 length:222 start_codon:yes stop_codon:yes gene_type:complete
VFEPLLQAAAWLSHSTSIPSLNATPFIHQASNCTANEAKAFSIRLAPGFLDTVEFEISPVDYENRFQERQRSV